MPGAPRFRRTRFHAASRFRRSQSCPHRLCHLRRGAAFFEPDAPDFVRISSATRVPGVFPAGTSLDPRGVLVRPSSVTSPSVPRPFAPSPPFWGRAAPSTSWRRVTRRYPRFHTTTGSCVTSQPRRAPTSVALIWPATAGPMPTDPARFPRVRRSTAMVPCCPHTPCSADSSSMCLRHLAAGSASSAWPTGSRRPSGAFVTARDLASGSSDATSRWPPCPPRPADGGCPLSIKLLGGSPSDVADGILPRLLAMSTARLRLKETLTPMSKRPTGRAASGPPAHRPRVSARFQ